MLDATNAFSIYVDEKRELAGIPEDVLQAAREAAQKDGKDGWKFTLHMPSYLPVMQYADDRALRETMYRANATRASEFGKPEWDNTPLIARILALRREMAQLLGYRDFAEVSLVPKMADSPSQVLAFLDDLARARAAVRRAATWRSCAPSRATELGIADAARPGTSPTPRRSCARSATRSPTRR